MSLLAILAPPRSLPAPDPRCRVYSTAEACVMFRNHEEAVRMSAELYDQSPADSPRRAAGVTGQRQLSEGERYAQEQAPPDDVEASLAADFHFGLEREAS